MKQSRKSGGKNEGKLMTSLGLHFATKNKYRKGSTFMNNNLQRLAKLMKKDLGRNKISNSEKSEVTIKWRGDIPMVGKAKVENKGITRHCWEN